MIKVNAHHRLKATASLARTKTTISYAVYCSVLDGIGKGNQVTAFSLPTGITKLFSTLKESFAKLSEELGVGIEQLALAFKQKDVFALLKGIGFNLGLLVKAIKAGTALIPKGIIHVFGEMEKSGMLESLKKGTIKIDKLLHKYPLLTKVAGIALAGLLVWIWLSMSFTGNPDFDLDVSTILLALKGKFDLVDLFASPSGLAMLTFLATGVFTGVGAAWLGENAYNVILALIFTGAKKARQTSLFKHLSQIIVHKKVRA